MYKAAVKEVKRALMNLEVAKNHFNYAIKPQFVEIAIQEINLAQAQLDIALKRVKLLAPMQK